MLDQTSSFPFKYVFDKIIIKLESCAFISDLEKNSEHKLYSSDPLDLELEDFINNKLITKERVNNIVDEIERSFLKDINDLKDELCK